MDKRFITFVAGSVVIMTGFMLLQMFFAKPPAKKPIPLAEKKVEKNDKNKNDDRTPDPQRKPEDPEGGEKPKPAVGSPIAHAAPAEWISLGSLDYTTGYRFLVTLNNRGAAVERIEIANSQYVDLEDWTSYIGHLALEGANGKGCKVNVVGHGTPANLATCPNAKPGLLAGDVILALNGTEVNTPKEFDVALKATAKRVPPGAKGPAVELKITRQIGGKATPLVFTTNTIHRPMEIVRPEFGTATDPDEMHPLSYLLTLHSIGPFVEDRASATVKVERGKREIKGLPSLRNSNWAVSQLKDKAGAVEGVEFRYQLDEEALKEIGQTGELEVIKRFRLAATPSDKVNDNNFKSYHLDFDLEFINHGEQPLQVAYQLDGPTGLPLEGWWYQTKLHPGWWKAAGARDVIWDSVGLGHNLVGCPEIHSNAIAATPKTTWIFESGNPVARRQLNYVGVDALYFTSSLVPFDRDEQTATSYIYEHGEALPAPTTFTKLKTESKTFDVTFELVSPPTRIDPEKTFKHSFLLFAGPKEPKLLAKYGLEETIEYGWFWWVGKPLVWILHRFEDLVGNWGVAIIMLTILVRGCMFPISRKMAKNMKAMQDLQPEMKALKEKYKDDLQKLGKAQQDLFRKNKINPYAGCLPLFLQMPIFMGLYRALAVDISLRQASLIPGILWASNLAGPDMLWKWEDWLPAMLGDETGYLGPYLNVFPIITAGLFLVQQYLFTPPPTDEQQEMQQKMMYVMTLVMSVMFFKVPAGLCVYFITSSLWGIAERTLMMPKNKSSGDSPAAAEKKAPPKPGPNGAGKEDTRVKQKKR